MAGETLRIEKTTDMTVSMRHIARHVKGLRENDPEDSKHCNPRAYLEELGRVLSSCMSALEDVAYIMRKKGMKNVPEKPNEGIAMSLKEAKLRVFHNFTQPDFNVANKIRYYLTNSNHPNVEAEFSEEELLLQFNILRACYADAFATLCQ